MIEDASSGSRLDFVALDLQHCRQILDAKGYPPGVDPARHAAIQKFVRPVDQLRAWAGEICARFLLINTLHCAPQDVQIVRDRFNKPCLQHGAGDAPEFNISHSGDWAVAVCSDRNIGVDIEQHQAVDWAVCRICFTPAERALLENCADESEKSQLFFRLWTLKEAYIKARGMGMQIDLQSFAMRPQGKLWHVDVSTAADKQVWQLFTPEFRRGYSLAVCRAGESSVPLNVESHPGTSHFGVPHNLSANIQQLIDVVYTL